MIRKKLIKKMAILAVVVCAVSICSTDMLSALGNDQQTDNDDVLVSSDVSVCSYQIRTSNESVTYDNVAFRTIIKAPNIGSVITVGDEQYTVAKAGIIYVLDPNCSGVTGNDVLNDKYTLLDHSELFGEDNKYYIGRYTYENNNITYGYLSTDIGVKHGYKPEDTENTYYVRTITNVGDILANSIHIRAFVVTTEGEVIYGTNTNTTSVAKVAYTLYSGNMMNTKIGFDFLYDRILNSEELKTVAQSYINYPYYMTTPLEYGWGGIYAP